MAKSPKLLIYFTYCLICLSCICRFFYICAFNDFILSTSTSMCTHLIFMCQSDWGKDQPSLPFIRHKTLNLTSMATKIIGSPETKWIDATSGIYNSEKSSNLSITTDFSESLQSSVSIWRSGKYWCGAKQLLELCMEENNFSCLYNFDTTCKM